MFGYDSYGTRVIVFSGHLGCILPKLPLFSGNHQYKLFHYLSLAFYVVSLTAANANLCGTTGCILQNPSHSGGVFYTGAGHKLELRGCATFLSLCKVSIFLRKADSSARNAQRRGQLRGDGGALAGEAEQAAQRGRRSPADSG